ncbi:helix-turn-helix domain-containing protein [Streptomyces sp. NPDC049555]|uniref:helix-turn-helix domain-containing protein n=1 Tax=unclassified Streptomyces TaxID=2593676 RepID=UPI00343EA57A
MGLAERRKALGYSQESLAHLLGVDRTTIGRWESGKHEMQPALRRRYAESLRIGLAELDVLLEEAAEPSKPSVPAGHCPGPSLHGPSGSGEIDDMIRREFLRVIAVTGALAAFPLHEAEEAIGLEGQPPVIDFEHMNACLWQVYQLARSKESIHPVVRDQLAALNEALSGTSGQDVRSLCKAAGNLFQLAGELAFDANRYTDAAASYTLAASASKDAASFDLWACALTRQAYIDLHEGRHKEAAETLKAAERVARRGDTRLSTRHWVAAVQAEAYAGLGDFDRCEHALDEAEKVRDLDEDSHNGGWLRFDGSRLAEERGARYVQLGRLDLAEETLNRALRQEGLAAGRSFRRRGAVLVDLAAVGVKRRDPEQVIHFGQQALRLARESSSGYVARRLRALREGFGSLSRDHRVAGLEAEIVALLKA